MSVQFAVDAVTSPSRERRTAMTFAPDTPALVVAAFDALEADAHLGASPFWRSDPDRHGPGTATGASNQKTIRVSTGHRAVLVVYRYNETPRRDDGFPISCVPWRRMKSVCGEKPCRYPAAATSVL
jgi:hypothetical protein